MSGEFLQNLGYSLDEFSEEFLNNGFPKIYDEITDINVIKGFYERDITANTNLISLNKPENENQTSKEISFKIYDRSSN